MLDDVSDAFHFFPSPIDFVKKKKITPSRSIIFPPQTANKNIGSGCSVIKDFIDSLFCMHLGTDYKEKKITPCLHTYALKIRFVRFMAFV